MKSYWIRPLSSRKGRSVCRYRISGDAKVLDVAGAGGTDPPQNGPGTASQEKR